MNKINNIGLFRELTSCYDFQGFTEQEIWSRIAQKINIIIEHFKYLDIKFENEKANNKAKFDYLLDEGLNESVAKIIIQQITDGTIEELINKSVLSEINNKMDNFHQSFTEQLDKNKNELSESITFIDNKKADKSQIGTPLVTQSVAGMTNIEKIYVNSSDGYWYYHNGSEWVQGGIYNSQGLSVNSVHIENTAFLNYKINPFNSEGSLIGYKMIGNLWSGYQVEQHSDYIISTFIEINNNNKIKLYNYGRITFFNVNKEAIDATGQYDENFNSTIDLSSFSNKPFYMKICIKLSDLNLMYLKLDNDFVYEPDVYFDRLKIKKENINDGEITANKTNFLIKYNNPFETEGALIGYKMVNNLWEGYRVIEDENFIISDFIEINNNENIDLYNYGRIAFFNESEQAVDGIGQYSDDKITNVNLFDFNEEKRVRFKYMKICISKSDLNNMYIKQQNIIYEKGIIFDDLNLKQENLSDEFKEEIKNITINSISEMNFKIPNEFKDMRGTSIVFEKNIDFNSTHFRIPFMCLTNKGTIIAGSDVRYDSQWDASRISLGIARSEDCGKTWIDKQIVIPNAGISQYSRVMDGTILATKEGRIFLIGNKFDDGTETWTEVNTPNNPNWDCVLYHSDDDGVTWQFNQSLKTLLPSGQISFLGGVGSGIQMNNGTLVFPIQMARYDNIPFNCQSGIIYSTDNGVTWHMSESLVPEYSSECSIVEYPTGTIIINCRQEGQNHRSVFKTTNLGSTWEETPMNTGTQQTNACQGHMCKVKVGFDKEGILFTNPVNDGTNRSDGAYVGYDRSNLSLSILQNDTKFTPIYTLYRPHSDGYSCMAFDERRNRLYVVMELEYNLVFRDITDLLPTIQLYKNLEL